MSEEQVLETTPEQVEAVTPEIENTLSTEDLVKAEIERVSQQYKKELSGLNRRNSELENILEEQKKAAMDEQEKILYELEQEKASLTNARADFTRMQNRENALKYASENGVPLSLLDTMSFDNWEAVESNLNTIKTVVDSERTKIIEEFKKQSGHVPAAGGGVPQGAYSPEAVAKMSPSEMTQALKEGRIPGFGKL